jgi:hypothetical protein
MQALDMNLDYAISANTIPAAYNSSIEFTIGSQKIKKKKIIDTKKC